MRCTLPGLLERLSLGFEGNLTHLAVYQQHAVYSFLVQLAAIALFRAGQTDPFLTEENWRNALVRLLPKTYQETCDPFCLIVKDLKAPGFMQPPVPEGNVDGWKTHACPDSLDVLVTSKNHDVKMARVSRASVDHWIYALISDQTMQGFKGQGHYGIARMNSGTGTRSCMTFAAGPTFVERFRRDVKILLENRAAIVMEHGYDTSGKGLALTWLKPWNGYDQLHFKELDPFFIESCARIRMEIEGKSLVARKIHVKRAHIDAEETRGNVGDPWTPTRIKDGAALTVERSGFFYDTVVDLLLSEDYQRPITAVYRPEDGRTPIVFFQALARTQGKTLGMHTRAISLGSNQLAYSLSDPVARADLYERAKAMIETAATVKKCILKPSVLFFVQATPDKIDFKDSRDDALMREFDDSVDAVFFDHLFAEATPPDPLRWTYLLLDLAYSLFQKATQSLPVPWARRLKAEVLAEQWFHHAVFRKFSDEEKGISIEWPRETEKESSPAEKRQRARVKLIATRLLKHTSDLDIAKLRHLEPYDVEHPEFRDIFRRFYKDPDSGPILPELDRPWTVLVQALTLLCGLHRGSIPLGTALARCGTEEMRVNSLLSASSEALHQHVATLAKSMASRGVPSNQSDLIDLVISDGLIIQDIPKIHEDLPDGHVRSGTLTTWSQRVRKRIATDYYTSL